MTMNGIVVVFCRRRRRRPPESICCSTSMSHVRGNADARGKIKIRDGIMLVAK